MKTELFPYYYPTNIVLIDDNEAFLTTLSLALSGSYNCQTFTDPLSALEHINRNYDEQQLKQRLQKKPSLKETFKNMTSPYQNQKYQELSVIVVDYDMPGLDGIELCSQLNNPFVRKVLLTGCASSNVVVKAFNDDVIDYYLDKQTDNLLGTVNQVVSDMQKAYFQKHIQTLTMDLIKKEAPCFLDCALADFFEDVCLSLDVDEYYFSPEKSHFVLHCGPVKNILIIMDDAKLEEHIQIIEEEDGPQEWINKLLSKRYVPYFDSGDGFYTPETQGREDPIFEATVVRGQQDYYCAVLSDQTTDNNIEKNPNNKNLH